MNRNELNEHLPKVVDAIVHSALQHPHPLRQGEIEISANENMNMIWHNDVTAKTNPARLAAVSEMNKLAVHLGIGEELATLMRVKRDKI